MSSTRYFPGALTMTKGAASQYVTQAAFDNIYIKRGWTLNGVSDPSAPSVIENSDILTWSFGASWTMDFSGDYHDKTWHQVCRETLGTSTHFSNGVGGSDSYDVGAVVCGSYFSGGLPFYWSPTPDFHGNAFVFVQTGVGIDCWEPSASNPEVALGASDNLSAIFAALSGGIRNEFNSTATFSSGWSSSAGHYSWSGTNNAGTYSFTQTQGATADITVVGDAVDLIAITYDGNTYRGRQFSITVDGQPFGTYDTDSRIAAASTWTWGRRAISLRGMGSGTHTVRITAGTGVSGAYCGFDYWVYPLPIPPVVVALKEYWLPSFGTQADWERIMGTGNTFDQAVASFKSNNPNNRLVIADLSNGWSNNFLGPDNLHPTQQGHNFIAEKAMKALLTTNLTFPST